MRTRSAASTTLGTVLALALTVAGAVAPAFAAEPAIHHQTIDIRETDRPRPPRPPVKPGSGVLFKPDVSIKYVGQDYDNGTYFFRFRVENRGAASADVRVDRIVRQASYLDEYSAAIQHTGAIKIDNLGTDESTEVRVWCVPNPGRVCMGASAELLVEDDLDPSDNMAYSHH